MPADEALASSLWAKAPLVASGPGIPDEAKGISWMELVPKNGVIVPNLG